MYRQETETSAAYFEYVGMAEDIEAFMNTYDIFTIQGKDGEAILDNIIDQATRFREKQLMNDEMGLHIMQSLERSVELMMPYANKYVRAHPWEFFVYGLGIKGIHYFKLKKTNNGN